MSTGDVDPVTVEVLIDGRVHTTFQSNQMAIEESATELKLHARRAGPIPDRGGPLGPTGTDVDGLAQIYTGPLEDGLANYLESPLPLPLPQPPPTGTVRDGLISIDSPATNEFFGIITDGGL